MLAAGPNVCSLRGRRAQTDSSVISLPAQRRTRNGKTTLSRRHPLVSVASTNAVVSEVKVES